MEGTVNLNESRCLAVTRPTGYVPAYLPFGILAFAMSPVFHPFHVRFLVRYLMALPYWLVCVLVNEMVKSKKRHFCCCG